MLELNELKELYPEEVKRIEMAYVMSDAMLHKTLNKHHKDMSVNKIDIEIETEDNDKLKLDNLALDEGIELDRRMTLKHMQEDFDKQMKELNTENYDE